MSRNNFFDLNWHMRISKSQKFETKTKPYLLVNWVCIKEFGSAFFKIVIIFLSKFIYKIKFKRNFKWKVTHWGVQFCNAVIIGVIWIHEIVYHNLRDQLKCNNGIKWKFKLNLAITFIIWRTWRRLLNRETFNRIKHTIVNNEFCTNKERKIVKCQIKKDNGLRFLAENTPKNVFKLLKYCYHFWFGLELLPKKRLIIEQAK